MRSSGIYLPLFQLSTIFFPIFIILLMTYICFVFRVSTNYILHLKTKFLFDSWGHKGVSQSYFINIFCNNHKSLNIQNMYFEESDNGLLQKNIWLEYIIIKKYISVSYNSRSSQFNSAIMYIIPLLNTLHYMVPTEYYNNLILNYTLKLIVHFNSLLTRMSIILGEVQIIVEQFCFFTLD